MTPDPDNRAVVIGGGPAGLMAAETLALAGVPVDLFDAMPSVGRKFLLAGKGGLNLTHSEPFDGPASSFAGRYAERSAEVSAWLDRLSPQALRDWAAGLGIDTFVGTSGRVFPAEMKAAPLLRGWLHRLRGQGVRFHQRQRWQGWTDDGALRFVGPQGEHQVRAAVTVLALGGASWPQLGSDGEWARWLLLRGVNVAALRPSNCGFEVGVDGRESGWSEHLRTRFAGAPIKPVRLRFVDLRGDVFDRQGEFVLTEHGIEGSLVYAASARLRDAIDRFGEVRVELDLLPGLDAARVLAEVERPRGPRSLSTHLKSRLGIDGAKAALLHEVLPKLVLDDAPRLAASLKALPLRLLEARPIDEAISSAGGVRLEVMNEHLMLNALPGVFCAGEMLDWEAPTGGYLLNAVLASGRVAGQGAANWLTRAL